MLIFEKSQENRRAGSQKIQGKIEAHDIPSDLLRWDLPHLPELSELEVVRHFTQLSTENFSIDTHFYPLGSCTMKYNPRAANRLASLPGYLKRHPLTPEPQSQSFLQCLYELQIMLADITGMEKVSLTSMAGAQGEFAGVAMIKAYHESSGDYERTEMLVPEAAHGTNPASAAMCGYSVKEVATTTEGDIDLEKLKKMVGPKTAGIMLTNPSTLGVFERKIIEVSKIIHDAGGLLYYDGANLNAILGKYRPGDMGFDVMHLNLHKTFATPHGGGGPGAGPVAASKRLVEFLPVPMIGKNDEGYYWITQKHRTKTIGRLSTFMGNAGVLLRAYIYLRMLGKEGTVRVAEFSTLNANYLMKRLAQLRFTLAFPNRRASHEFIVTVKPLTRQYGITALDIAKRFLDYGFHAPTIYFPLLIPECLLIEPTETESKQTLDRFIEALQKILVEIKDNSEIVQNAPHRQPVGRLDEVKAARDLDLRWYPPTPKTLLPNSEVTTTNFLVKEQK
ncbi:aminomethyl-transferring glycine dehydrogenase subunit GcvPB [Candidatus Coxiella mudrowiae]|uniref:Probable glycine dehydrogenase (decarboxylating) subunit 2 n=1 Tax=Candidatus Coxiella mudrowiae TaxID=2054173 RepID=A0ABM5UTI7_9COXI|nr:aminomethyl-transferring glycine dehydrogenase subunit GcvPB [Candidatus Coxiella mudrowiae]AKQ33237.1 putative glycine dehydrogenase [decarboxylating] subunit 2 [Candidatus Coxiella mudrowiae]